MYTNKFTIHTCPLCGSTHLAHFLDCTDHYATGEQFALFECKECGFRFTQDAPEENEIGPYYESPDYISHSDTHKGLMNRIYHRVRRHMLKKKVALVCEASGLRRGKVLDYGAGTGYFIHSMQECGWNVEAIEKSPKAREFAQKHFGLTLKPETELDRLASRSFDVVTLWHVMEHVEQLDHLWQRLSEILDPMGTLVVAVPNCDSYDARHYGAYWAAYDVPRHLWHFSPDTMVRMAQKHGFALKVQKPMPFDAFYISMLSEKYMGKSSYFLRGMWTGFKAWLVCLFNSRRSSSVIYVFEKNK